METHCILVLHLLKREVQVQCKYSVCRFGLFKKRMHKLSSSSFIWIWICSFITSYAYSWVSFWTDFKEHSIQAQPKTISVYLTHSFTHSCTNSYPKTAFANDMQTLHKWGLTCYIFVTKYFLAFCASRRVNEKKSILFCCEKVLWLCAKHRYFVNLHNALLFIQSFRALLGLRRFVFFLLMCVAPKWYSSCLLQFKTNNFNFYTFVCSAQSLRFTISFSRRITTFFSFASQHKTSF